MRHLILLLFASMVLAIASRAQTVQLGQQLQEIIKINEVYSGLPNLSFNVNFQYRDTLSQPLPDEQLSGQYKITQGRFWAMIDSTELIQGFNYFITVYHGDSAMTVAKPTSISGSVLQLPFLDSLYRQNYVDSMAVIATNDSIRKLTIYFAPSLGTTYQLFYKSTTYFVDSIKYSFPNTDTVGTSYVTAKYTGYSTAVIDEQYFLESKFITRDGTSFYLKPNYSSYDLMINGDFGQTAQ